MEQRKFCANCKAPMVKGASFCVVCGGHDFVSPQVEEPIKAVEIDDAVVSAPVESRFIVTSNEVKTPTESSVPVAPVQVEIPPVYEQKPAVQEYVAPQSAPVPHISMQERTVVYKSFEEYERELAAKEQENQAANNEPEKKKGGAKAVFKKIGVTFLCIILSVALVFGGFVIGVYLTYKGALDEYLPEKTDELAVAYEKDLDDCYELQQELVNVVATYISDNKIYIDKTTVITIEATEEGKSTLVSVDGNCLTSSECAELFNNKYICPCEGTYTVSIIPYVDTNGSSMFKVEVKCDGGEEGWEHY